MTASQAALQSVSRQVSARCERSLSALARADLGLGAGRADRVERAPGLADGGLGLVARRPQVVDRLVGQADLLPRRGRGPRRRRRARGGRRPRPARASPARPTICRCSSCAGRQARLDLALRFLAPARRRARARRRAPAAGRARSCASRTRSLRDPRVLARLEQAPLRGGEPSRRPSAGPRPGGRSTRSPRPGARRGPRSPPRPAGRRAPPVPASARSGRCHRRPARCAARSRRWPSPAGGSPPSSTRWPQRRRPGGARCRPRSRPAGSTARALRRQPLAQVLHVALGARGCPALSSRPDPPSTTRGPWHTSPSGVAIGAPVSAAAATASAYDGASQARGHEGPDGVRVRAR